MCPRRRHHHVEPRLQICRARANTGADRRGGHGCRAALAAPVSGGNSGARGSPRRRARRCVKADPRIATIAGAYARNASRRVDSGRACAAAMAQSRARRRAWVVARWKRLASCHHNRPPPRGRGSAGLCSHTACFQPPTSFHTCSRLVVPPSPSLPLAPSWPLQPPFFLPTSSRTPSAHRNLVRAHHASPWKRGPRLHPHTHSLWLSLHHHPRFGEITAACCSPFTLRGVCSRWAGSSRS